MGLLGKRILPHLCTPVSPPNERPHPPHLERKYVDKECNITQNPHEILKEIVF